jgi:Zn-dependent protease with chaperone function
VIFYAHGTTLALAWYLAINMIASLAVAFAAQRLAGSSRRLLAMRLLPAAASLVFTVGVFVPSYVLFEPRDVAEGIDVTLTALAATAGAVILGACARSIAAWLRAARRARVWTQAASPLVLPGAPVPAFRIEAPRPLMALVGIVRPRLIVSSGLVDALTPEELEASVAHELGHHKARDNFKRLAMRGAPDVLCWLPAAAHLERRWAAAAEHTADAAGCTTSEIRLALASALVKVARLMPAPGPAGEPISTLVGGGDIASRVERLIDERAAGEPSRSRTAARIAAVALAVASIALVYAPLLEGVHRTTEILVQRLP